MKKTLLMGTVFILVFIISLFIISGIMNKGNTDMTVEMGAATQPLVYIEKNGMKINAMRGYRSEMECSYMRDSITILPADRTLSIVVEKYNCNIEGISFEVRSVDGERLVEQTPIYNYIDKEDMITATISVKDLIDENEEYTLIFLIESEDGNVYRFYTRMRQAENTHEIEYLTFVKDFHERTFDKDAAKEITPYLESSAEGDNSTLNKVDIHCSFQQVTWADLDVERETQPDIFFKELGTQTASLQMTYMVSVKEGRKKQYYFVEEWYRVRYGKERMFLLDYERTMDQVFIPSAQAFTNNKLMLGITDTDLEFVESEGGNDIVFVQGNRLFAYNITENKFAILFGFYDKSSADKRTVFAENDIRVLSVDEAGNIRFMVYGYMNRGRHEGNVGIQIYNYSSILNTIEEEVYIPYTRSFDLLQNELSTLTYVSRTNILYLILSGTLYEINLERKNYEVVVSNLREGSFEVSGSNSMIVWQNGESGYHCEELILMNLNTKKQTIIPAGIGNYIRPLGFMGEDLIYGMAKKSDLIIDETGSIIFPMYTVKIQDEANEEQETYKKEGIYITEAEIVDNQITLTRVQKNEEGNDYIQITSDQIMNNEKIKKGTNFIEKVITELYETVVQITLKSEIIAREVKFLTPKEVLFEGGRELALTNKEEGISRYYVYGKNGIEGAFTNPAKAITLANSVAGVVTGDTGNYVWRKGNVNIKNQIMAIKEASVTEEKNSVVVCMDTIFEYEGTPRNTEYLFEKGGTVLSVLEDNLPDAQVLDLTGCTLESVLYYVDKDIPVLALMQDNTAVLIIGFNELNTVIMDPITGMIYKKGMNDSKAWFEENGNSFVTYIKN